MSRAPCGMIEAELFDGSPVHMPVSESKKPRGALGYAGLIFIGPVTALAWRLVILITAAIQ